MTRRRYPDLDDPVSQPLAPLRGRRRRSQGRARRARSPGAAPRERARARIDLAVVSVLLDAGAGRGWRYVEARDGPALHALRGTRRRELSRVHGAARSPRDADDPLRVDAAALATLDAAALAATCSRSATDNPLVGLDGRAALLRRLGDALRRAARRVRRDGAPGRAVRHADRAGGAPRRSRAAAILRALLDGLGADLARPAARSTACRSATCGGIRTPAASGRPPAGCRSTSSRSGSRTRCSSRSSGPASRSTGRDELTALPEYRNGGLLLDTGVLALRDAADARARRSDVGSELVVEWRALTVALLDELAPRVRAQLGAPRPAARLHPRGRHLGRRARARRASCAAASPPLVDRQRRHGLLISQLRDRRLSMPSQRPRVRPPARPAQAHAAAQEGDQHDELPPPAERDRLADGLRGHARHADARGRDRDAARDDERAG